MFNKIIFEIFHCDIKFILNTMNTWYVEVIQNQKDTSLITIKHSFGHMTASRSIKIQIWPVPYMAHFRFSCVLVGTFMSFCMTNLSFWLKLRLLKGLQYRVV